MTPLAKLARGILERRAGIWREGPEPPARLGEMVVAFANDCPRASRADWVRFCQLHAAECYRSGYARGAERAERDFWGAMPSVLPEEVMDELDPDWRWRPDIRFEGARDEVVEDRNQEGADDARDR